MTPYEQYLLSEYKPPTIENNPVSIFGKSAVTPDWNMDSQIQGELANKPAYNSNGRRYGSTLSDDMIDIKNNRRGNPETSNHPWVGGYDDYDNFTNAEPKIPVLEKIDYTPAVLRSNDFRDNAVSRQKNVTEGNYDWYGESPYAYLPPDAYEYEPSDFQDPDYAQAIEMKRDYDVLMQQINDLRAEGRTGANIRDDMNYIKSGGNYNHDPGDMWPRSTSEFDPALPTDDGLGLLVNPERLSPATAELIAKNTTRNRPEPLDPWGEKAGLNPLINAYRKMLGMGQTGYAGGPYMQGIY